MQWIAAQRLPTKLGFVGCGVEHFAVVPQGRFLRVAA